MRIRFVIAMFVILALVVPALMLARDGKAVTAKQLVGTWKVVSVTNERDGKKIDGFGPNPQGITSFIGNGRFVRVLTRSDLPKFASNNRNTGTPNENQAVMQGSIAYFGTYSCTAAEKSCTYHIEGGTFPNWVGADQKRVLTLTGDELRETNPAASTGGNAVLVWKRVQ
ncbi:MAG: lipocalin-like domain-containing protein [Candidatus Korobacteraceae bacterium]|jgi:hypothetical protein